MRDRLGANPVPIQLPIGEEEHHVGVVDLVEMRAIVYEDELGQSFTVGEIPAEHAAAVRAALRAATLAGDIVPVLCGSAYRYQGVEQLLDAVRAAERELDGDGARRR